MEGRLFCDRNKGKVGPNGHLDHQQSWCVKTPSGKNFHIHTILTGEFGGKPSSKGGPMRKTTITACDGSCKKLSPIPPSVWSQAEPQIIEAIHVGNYLLPDITQDQLDIVHLAGNYSGA